MSPKPDQDEQVATTTANVGAFPVPLGCPRCISRRKRRRKRVAERLRERNLAELCDALRRAVRS